MTFISSIRLGVLTLGTSLLLGGVLPAQAQDATAEAPKALKEKGDQKLEKIHFLIPGGAGGGWDGTARGTGEALSKSGLVGNVSYENMSGGGGGKAISYLIENAKSNEGTLMVHSTPIIIRSLSKIIPQSFRDITPVAGIIGDYAAFIVHKDSPFQTLSDFLNAYKEDPRKIAVGGGSAPGSMDHLVGAMLVDAAGYDPLKMKYVPYDAGGKAMAGLLSGEIAVLSTGFSEAVALAEAGEVRILAVTSAQRAPAFPDVPTVKEQGVDMDFVNWRGFFAVPGLSEEKQKEYQETLKAMYETQAWEDVRARNGWVNIFNPGDDFVTFLTEQEKSISELMKKLGFL